MSSDSVGLITRLGVSITTGDLRQEIPPFRFVAPIAQQENLQQLAKLLTANDVTGTLSTARFLLPEAKKYMLIVSTRPMQLKITDGDNAVVYLTVNRCWFSDGAVKSVEIFNVSTTETNTVRVITA